METPTEDIKVMDKVRFIRLKEIERNGKRMVMKEELHRGVAVNVGSKFIKIYNPNKKEKDVYDAGPDSAESYPIFCKRGWVEKMP